MSWESTIEPGRVSLRIRLRTTAGPGRFQSSGSTSQRMMSYPNSSWIHRFSRSVIDPYGGRSNVGLFPVALLIASSVRCNWLRTLSCDILARLGCDQLWLAISCPSRAARATMSGCSATFSPMTKNVALVWCAASKSSSFGVSTALGPSSKVIAMYGPSTCTELNVIADSLGGAGLFDAASFSRFGDTALGAASIERAGIPGLGGGAGGAASATAKLNLAAHANNKR